MKAIRLLSILFLTIATACGGSDASKTDLDAARNAGRRHAEAALAMPENSMQREKAIFAIRARETRLRDAGYESCADAYIESASKVLGYK